jgi:TP901 family phage tail tape measure protein
MSTGGTGEVLDILLKLSNLQGFVAGTREAAGSVRDIGKASTEASAESKASSGKMAGAAGLVQKAWMTTAAAVGYFAYKSGKMAIDFQQQMELIHTQAGASQGEVTKMSKAILDMSASGMYAQGPVKLAEGLYHLESIGLRAPKALDALKIAAQGAAVGNADLESTSTALGAAWLVGIKGAGNLNSVMGILNATTGAGNIRMQELVDSLGTGVLASAKLAGLGIGDVMGALATLTDEGYQGSSAMAQLATSFHFLTDPTQKAQKALHSIGLDTYTLSNTMRTQGLPAALRMLRDHLSQLGPAQAEAKLGDILPGGRGRVLEVLMNQVDRYGRKMTQISNTSKNFAQDVAATHKTAAFRIHAAWSQIQSDMIHLGNILIPVGVAAAAFFAGFVHQIILLLPLLAKIAPYLIPIVAGFLAYKGAILAVRAAQIVGTAVSWAYFAAETAIAIVTEALAGEFTTLAVLIALVASPMLLVVAVIGVLIGALVLLYMKNKWFRNAIGDAWKWIKQAASDAIGGIVSAFHWLQRAAGNVVNFIRHHWRQLILIMGPFGLAVDFVTRHFQWFKTAVGNVFNYVAGKVLWAYNNRIKPVFNWIGNAAKWLVTYLENRFQKIGEGMYKPIKWAWDHVIKPVFNWIVGAAKWMANEVAKAFTKGPIGKLISVVGGVSGGISHAAGGVAHFLGIAQEGGTITSPGATLVGERGPEILNLPRGSVVQPLSPAFASPGAIGANMTFVIPVQIDGREVARATGKYVDNRLARQ